MNDSRKWAWPAILGALGVLAWIGIAGSPLREYSLDAPAQRYVDDGLKRALVTFATARTINAVLSTVQGTTLALEPFGIGVQLSVGQALHPLNHVVGQFADWMLAASVAFGVMEVLVRVGSSLALALVLTAAIVAWGICRWRSGAAPPWLTRAVVLLVVLRFAVPVVTVGSEWIYLAFLSDEYSRSQSALSVSAKEVDGVATGAAAATATAPGTPDAQARQGKPSTGGFVDWLTSKLAPSPAAESKPEPGMFERWKAEAQAKIAHLKSAAESLTEHVVRLMVVFLLQTLVIPVLLLWAMLRLVATLGRTLH